MRLLAITLALTVLFSFGAKAQDVSIEDVISMQIDAFKADDFDTAFTYASPNIRSMFGTAENFGSMVRGSYPMVWRPSELTFLGREDKGNATMQRLKVTDRQGTPFWFVYEMVLIDGQWRINGVFRLKSPGLTA